MPGPVSSTSKRTARAPGRTRTTTCRTDASPMYLMALPTRLASRLASTPGWQEASRGGAQRVEDVVRHPTAEGLQLGGAGLEQPLLGGLRVEGHAHSAPGEEGGEAAEQGAQAVEAEGSNLRALPNRLHLVGQPVAVVR